MSADLICLGSKWMSNCCGIFGGAKDCVLTGTPGCWVTSMRVRSSFACGEICTLGSARVTVPVTSLGIGACAGALLSAGMELLLEGPQPPSNNPAITSGNTSLRMWNPWLVKGNARIRGDLQY